MVVCILATVTYCSCVPINPSGTQDEIQFELGNVGAKAVIYLEEDSAHIKRAAMNLGIVSIYLQPANSNAFPPPGIKSSRGMRQENMHDQISFLFLFVLTNNFGRCSHEGVWTVYIESWSCCSKPCTQVSTVCSTLLSFLGCILIYIIAHLEVQYQKSER